MKNSHFATAGILAVFALPGCGGGGSSSPSPPQTYTVGGVVSGLIGSGLVLLDNAGNALTISSNGGFTFPTPVPSGVTYDVTVGTQPTSPPSSLPQSCSVSSGAGTVMNSNVSTVDVSCVTNSARFVYLTNGGSNNVSGYSIDNATGALTQLSGSPYSAGTKPVSLTIHPSGKFVYVSNSGENSISAYAVDGGTGSLTAIAGSPYFVTPYAPTSDWLTPVTIDPSGQLAVVGNPNAAFAGSGSSMTQPGNLDIYSINVTTGALTPVSGSPFTTGAFYPTLVAIDPHDKFIYAVSGPYQGADESVLSAYSIDPSGQTVSAVSGSPFGPLFRQATSFTISRTGTFAYLTNDYTQTISCFTITAATGSFTVPDSACSIPGNTIAPPALTASGKFLYVVGSEGDGVGIVGSSIDGATGVATEINGSPFAAGISASVTIDPSSKHVYAVSANATGSGLNVGNAIFAFDIDASTGVLSPVAGSPFDAAPASDTVSASLAIEPSGRFAYLPSATSNVIYAFSIDPSTGALTVVSGSPFPTGTLPGVPVFLY